MKPISDRRIAALVKEIAHPELGINEFVFMRRNGMLKALRELARTRAAIREHRDEVSEVSCQDQDIKEVDRDLWKATLPEGDR